ncbi:MAG TPA: aromatic ring-hydroxylating dioxygenase subunit alpha [Caulobacteraceae bacterium]|nr:aromatic ring-hydroxylating dioxygenase subunit alpha [Caulobacteraceae bacterium]
MAEGDARVRSSARAGFGRGFLTDIWYFVGLSADLRPGRIEGRELLGERVVVGRTRSGEAFALGDICPHRAALLSGGRLRAEADGAEALECPYHGWRFGIDGACRAIPSLASAGDLDIARIRVRRYPVAESQGMAFVWVAADPRSEVAPPEPPPRFEGVVGGAPKAVVGMDFEVHVDHACVMLVDPSHAPFVHAQWWWRSVGSQHLKSKRFAPVEAGFVMERHAPSRNSRPYALFGGAPMTEITFRLPGVRWEHVSVGARQLLSLAFLTPVSETRTRMTQIIWSDHPMAGLAAPFIRYGARRFLEQDRELCRLQAEGLKRNPAYLWIDDADRQARWYVALKREWGESRAERRPFVNPVEPTTLSWRS